MFVLHGQSFDFSLNFFFNDPATTEIYTLSRHDALPISGRPYAEIAYHLMRPFIGELFTDAEFRADVLSRSEEHTSELQSHHDLVCRLLHEKKQQRKSREGNKATETQHKHHGT